MGTDAITSPVFFTNPKDDYEMVLVPGGEFCMGSEDGDTDARDNEKPRHLNRLAPYYIGIYCVTVAQFGRFVQATGHDAGSEWQKDPANHPVRYVNWHDAVAYLWWAGLRLPREAEWELAARGYEGRKYPWGEEWEDGRRVCWDKQKGPGGTTVPVDAHPESVGPFGTYQQVGNVWEWCVDIYDKKAFSRYRMGSSDGGAGGRVLRGASWGDGAIRGTSVARSGRQYNSWLRYQNYGFRLARTAL